MTEASGPLASANLALRFLLEVAALVTLGYWGYRTGNGLVRWGLALGLPLAVAVVWGLFGSPAAPYRLGGVARTALEVAILGGAAGALALVDRPLVAAGFAVVAAVNTLLLHYWGQA